MPSVPTLPGNLSYTTTIAGEIELFEARSSDDVTSLLNSLSITESSHPIQAVSSGNNRWLLGAGAHGGAVMQNLGVTALEGISLKCRVGGKIVCKYGTTTFISGLEFNNGGLLDGPLLVVDNGARVLVSNCIFAQGSTTDTSPIQLEAGSKTAISNCIFTGMSQTTNPVLQHVGNPANAVIAFCHNLTGNALFTPAVAQAFNLVITVAGNVGDAHQLNLDGTGTIVYVVGAGDTPTTVVDGLISGMAAKISERPVVFHAGGGSLSVIAKEPGIAFTLVYSAVGVSAAGVLTATQANVLAGAVGTGNIA